MLLAIETVICIPVFFEFFSLEHSTFVRQFSSVVQYTMLLRILPIFQFYSFVNVELDLQMDMNDAAGFSGRRERLAVCGWQGVRAGFLARKG